MFKHSIKNFSVIVVALVCVNLSSTAQYQIATSSVSGKKTITITKWAPGFIMDLNGEKKQGQIQLKIVNSDTIQVKMKGESGKEVFARLDIQYFGLLMQAGNYETFKDQRKNFQKGYIVDNEGNLIEGRLALRYNDDLSGRLVEQLVQAKWKVHVILFEGADTYVKDLWPENIKEIGQLDENGNTIRFERMQTVWTEVLVEGGKYQLLQNPYSTIVDKQSTKLSNAINNTKIQSDVKLKAMKDVKVTDSRSEADKVIYEDQFILRKSGEEKGKLITDNDLEGWIEAELSTCKAFQELDNKTVKKLSNWKNLVELVKWANEYCK